MQIPLCQARVTHDFNIKLVAVFIDLINGFSNGVYFHCQLDQFNTDLLQFHSFFFLEHVKVIKAVTKQLKAFNTFIGCRTSVGPDVGYWPTFLEGG